MLDTTTKRRIDTARDILGGKRKFFTKEFARYGWAKLMDPSIGGHEMIALYGEGISKMPENPGIPLVVPHESLPPLPRIPPTSPQR